jgi:hypothetical protein
VNNNEEQEQDKAEKDTKTTESESADPTEEQLEASVCQLGELAEQIGHCDNQADQSLRELYTQTVSIIPTLRDLGQNHLADRFQRIVDNYEGALNRSNDFRRKATELAKESVGHKSVLIKLFRAAQAHEESRANTPQSKPS